MSYKMTKEHFRNLLDEEGLSHKVDDDGDFIAQLDADKDCRFDVTVIFCVSDAKILTLACAFDMKLENDKISDAVLFCNDWNAAHVAPNAYVDIKNKVFSVQCVTWTDIALSDEYVRENTIKFGLALSWGFFKEASKQF